MTASSLLTKLGAAAATGAVAFTSFAGTGLAAGSSHVSGLNLSDWFGMHSADDCDCNDVSGFGGLHFKHSGSLNDDCDNDVDGFDVGDFFDAFDSHLSPKTATVNADADTTVNSTINAGSSNNVDIDQDGGVANADVDASADTDVNSEINALSENNVSVSQN
jgi:hypothetical protein